MYFFEVIRFLADKLRTLASRLDGRQMFDVEEHKAAVEAMNRYVGRTERFIVALETYIERENTCDVCSCCLIPREGPRHCDTCSPDEEQEEAWRDTYLFDPVKDLRKQHGRFDTKPLIEAGSWP